jgi:predicted nucleotidyltransferase
MYSRIFENEVKSMAEELRNAGIAVEKVILFGSRLIGRPAPESDIDLLIVCGGTMKVMAFIRNENPSERCELGLFLVLDIDPRQE